MSRTWYVLHVKPRTEKAVNDRLAILRVFHYLPLFRKETKVQRRKVVRFLPVFPGYVFTRLSPEERKRLTSAGMSERHARALLRLDNAELRRVALDRMIGAHMTVAQSDRLVEDMLAGRIRRRPAKPLVKDVRVFFNTVNHALDIMRRGGIAAESQRREDGDYIEYVVRIPKKPGAVPPPPAVRQPLRA